MATKVNERYKKTKKQIAKCECLFAEGNQYVE